MAFCKLIDQLSPFFAKCRKLVDKMIHQKKNRGHWTAEIIKSRQGHLPYHCLSLCAHAWCGLWICVHSKDVQKQLAWTFLIGPFFPFCWGALNFNPLRKVNFFTPQERKTVPTHLPLQKRPFKTPPSPSDFLAPQWGAGEGGCRGGWEASWSLDVPISHQHILKNQNVLSDVQTNW